MEKIVDEIGGVVLGMFGTITVITVLAALLGENGVLREVILKYLV